MLNLFRKKDDTGSAFKQPGTQTNPLARLFDKNEKEVARIRPLVDKINAFGPELKELSDDDLKARSQALKAKFQERVTERLSRLKDAEGEPLEWRELDTQLDWSDDYNRARRQAETAVLDELLPEAFALTREAGDRTIGLRHFDVQMIGGAVLHSGRIAEMRTGEGKTLVATAPAYLNALSGRGVHVITVNDYLAERDANWMRPIFEFLGMTVSALANEMPTEARQEAYKSDILYATNAEVGFDYLRDNMARDAEETVQRPLNFAIVDEVDNILIDEARTPLIISAQVAKTERAQRRQQMSKTCDGLARRLMPGVTDREVEALIDTFTHKGRLDTDGLLDNLLKRGAFAQATSYLIDAYLLAEKSARTEAAARLLDVADEFYDAKLLNEEGRAQLETLAVNAVRPAGVRAAWEKELSNLFSPLANAWISSEESPDAGTRAASLAWELALSDDAANDLTAQLTNDEDAEPRAQTADILADEMIRRGLTDDAGRQAVTEALLSLPANADAKTVGAELQELALQHGALQEADALLQNALEQAGNGDTPEAARELVGVLEEVSRRGLLSFESLEALWEAVRLTQGRDGLRRAIADALSKHPGEATQQIGERVRAYALERDAFLKTESQTLRTQLGGHEIVANKAASGEDNETLRRALLSDLTKTGAFAAAMKAAKSFWAEQGRAHDALASHLAEEMAVYVEVPRDARRQLSNLFAEGGKAEAVRERILLAVRDLPGESTEVPALVSDIARQLEAWRQENAQKLLDAIATSGVQLSPEAGDNLRLAIENGDYSAGWEAFVGEQLLSAPEAAPKAEAVDEFSDKWDAFKAESNERLLSGLSEVVEMSPDLQDALDAVLHQPQEKPNALEGAILGELASEAVSRHLEPLLTEENAGAFTEELKTRLPLAKSTKNALRSAEFTNRSSEQLQRALVRLMERSFAALPFEDFKRVSRNVGWLVEKDEKRRTAALTDMGTLVAEREAGRPVFTDPEGFLDTLQAGEILTDDEAAIVRRAAVEAPDASLSELIDRALRLPAERRRRLSEAKFQEISPILDQSIKGHALFQREVNYVIDTNPETGKREIVIVDEFTGRKMPGRRYSEGLHEALEAKHGLEVQLESQTVATITIQNYFRLYHKLSGMTGTAKTEEQEFAKTYGIEVVAIPTNRVVRRQDHPDVVFKTNEAKMRAVTFEILEHHCAAQPVLCGTRSVEVSERLSERLKAPALQALVLSQLCKEQLRDNKSIAEDQRAAMLEVLRAPLVNPTPEEAHHLKSSGRRQEPASLMQIKGIAKMLNLPPDALHDDNINALLALFTVPNASRERLQTALKLGLPHSVLNAKNHRNEARIIAEAARPAAVTIATNMAGRGVDILLGGSLDVESRWRVMTLQTLARHLEGKPVHVRARNQDATDKFLDRLTPERLQLLAWATANIYRVDELQESGALQGQGVKEIRDILGAELTTAELQTKVRSRARRLNLTEQMPLDADPLKDDAPIAALSREISRLTGLTFETAKIREALRDGISAQTSGRDPVEGALLEALSVPLTFAWRATESLISLLPDIEDLDRKLLNAVVSESTTDALQLAQAVETVTPDWVTQRLGELQVTDAATAASALLTLKDDEIEVNEWQIAALMGEAFMGAQWIRQRFADWSVVGREARAYDAPEELGQALGDAALVHFRLLRSRAAELKREWESGGDARRALTLVEAPNALMLNDLANIVGPEQPFLEPQWLHYALVGMNIINEQEDVAQAQMMGMAQDEQGQMQQVPVDVLVYRVRLERVLERLQSVFRELSSQGKPDVKQARRALEQQAAWAIPFVDEAWIMKHLRAAQAETPVAQSGESQVFVETGVAGQSADIVLESEPRPEDVAHTSESEVVKELGGLHIIGTERHESRRIDNQLRGRAGRQGDPGSSRFYASLEDELWRLFGVRNQWLLNQWDEDEAVEAKLISKSIERAQKKVELNHFESRKHVLQYDDVMNVQREVIYRERRRALMGGDVRDTTLDMAGQAAISELEKHCPRDVKPEEWDTHRAYVELAKLFGAANLSKHLKADDLAELHWNAISETLGQSRYDAELQDGRTLLGIVGEMYEEREAALGAEQLRAVERWAVTRAIDEHWMEHLAEMDYLRDAIWQESYAQKEPIGVFRQEGFLLFQKMLTEVRRQVTDGIFGADANDSFALPGLEMPDFDEMTEARLLETGDFDLEGYDDGVQLLKDADGDDAFEPELRDGFAPALVSDDIDDEPDAEPEAAAQSPVVPQRSASLANPTIPTTAQVPKPQGNGANGNGQPNRSARRRGKKKR